jgi:hypothetical protein
MNKMKKFRWFWAWQDEQEAAWLRQMSKEGWHFKSRSVLGSYLFEQGVPVDYVYRLDFFVNRKDVSSDLQIFKDNGWEHVGEVSGWQYFRIKNTSSNLPNIFNDNLSKSKKYERLLLFLTIFLPIYLNMMVNVSRGEAGYLRFFTLLMSAFMVFYVYAMVCLGARIISSKKKA